MTAISVRNANTPQQRKLLKDATMWMVGEIIGSRLNLEITVTLYDLRKQEKCSGMCEWMDNPIRPRDFLLHVDNSQSLREQLRTIAHELIHVKQYATGEMYDYQRDWSKVRWRNKIVNSNNLKYKEHPWEIEAYKRQTPLLRKFLYENNINLKEYE